jgi:hypothetical protein
VALEREARYVPGRYSVYWGKTYTRYRKVYAADPPDCVHSARQ